MGLELEAKIKVDSHEPVRARLIAAGAQCRGTVLEVNRLFDDVQRSLYRSDRGLRIRVCRDLSNVIVSTTLTCKGPQQAGPFKCREELEVSVDDAGEAGRILNALGFAEVIRFEKRRESWLLDACRVELDELPQLGLFVEVEAPGEKPIRAALARLALENLPIIQTPYVALVAEHCRQAAAVPASLTF